MAETGRLVFFVNGEKVELAQSEPEWTLSYYLREKMNLTGTKVGCMEGHCGSCTVMVSHYCSDTKKIHHDAVNACLVPLYAIHGRAVITVEGVGSTNKGMHPIQERITRGHGSQCGYCTPGFVMSMYSLLRENQSPSAEEIEHVLHGNLCRCTGYRPIVESFYTFTKGGGCGIENCCQKKGANGQKQMLTNWTAVIKPYDASQEPIFPPELQVNSAQYDAERLVIKGNKLTLYRPRTAGEFAKLRKEHGKEANVVGYTIVAAALEKFSPNPHKVWITTSNVQEFQVAEIKDEGVRFGCALTFTQLGALLTEAEKKYGPEKSAFVEMFNWNVQNLFSKQLRNQSTWAGNLAQGQAIPTSDLTCAFLAAQNQVEITDDQGKTRTIAVDKDFYPGQNRCNIQPNEIIAAATIKASDKYDYFQTYRQGGRHGTAERGIVNAAFYLRFAQDGKVADARLVFGGVAPVPVLSQASQKLVGRMLDHDAVHAVVDILSDELKTAAPFQHVCAVSLFARFFADARKHHRTLFPNIAPDTTFKADADGTMTSEKRQIGNGDIMEPVQCYDDNSADDLGRPLVHNWADRHTTGEAQYTGDLKFHNMAHIGLVLSQRAHAKIVSIDMKEALAMPGVLGWVDVKDVPGDNVNRMMMGMPDDSPLFAHDGEVVCNGQTIGCVVATDLNVARDAARKVKVVYEDLPAIITLKEAVEKQNFMGPPVQAKNGDVEAVFKSSTHVIEGELHLGGQEHMYMEPQVGLAMPGEIAGELHVISSTQAPSAIQDRLATLLQVKQNKVKVTTKRLGGAFGGKQEDAFRCAGPAALAAIKFNRPVLCQLTRHEDGVQTGKRHELQGTFKASFTDEGKLTAMHVNAYVNGGYSNSVSLMISFVISNSVDSTYTIPVGDINCRTMKTNTQSNTAFRGFGNPQSYFITDTVMEHIAYKLKLAPEKVRALNMSDTGAQRVAGDHIVNENLKRCWAECMALAEVDKKREEFKAFNEKSFWRKRGIAIVPTRYLLGHGGAFEQGAALVNIYTDGSVLLGLGGVEMGQGLFIKCMQIAARALNVPLDQISVNTMDTDVTPNCMPTGGSQGTDVVGLAVKNGCEELLERLAPYVKQNPSGTWPQWVGAAHADRISLSCASLGVPSRANTHSRYASTGVACTEVELDCLTGDFKALATTIVMDMGNSLNPAIDIGQIEGGFLQGYGLFTMEEMSYGKNGILVSRSLFDYKIPTVSTIPRKFKVALLKDAETPGNIYSSKGIGEPPLYLGVSVYFAVLDAINAKRTQHGQPPQVVQAPLTVKKIRLACADPLLGKVMAKREEGSSTRL